MSLTAKLLELPQWLCILMSIVVLLTYSIGGFLIVHRFIPSKVRQSHNDVAGFVFASLGVTYGVLMAFVVFVVWAQFNEAKVNIANESSNSIVLYHQIQAYPDQAASQIMLDSLLKFAEHEQAHQAIQSDSLDHIQLQNEDEASLNQFFEIISGVVPKNDYELVSYSNIMDSMNDLAKYHNLRLQFAEEELPGILWVVILGGAMITMGFTFLFGTERVWAHIAIMSPLAILIAIVIYLIIEFDHPSLGGINIGTPTGYSRMIDMADQRH